MTHVFAQGESTGCITFLFPYKSKVVKLPSNNKYVTEFLFRIYEVLAGH